MSSILLEPILPNLTKVSGSREQLRDLWRLFTKVKDCTQGGRRLENLYWRLWYQSSTTGNVQESAKISSLLENWVQDSPTFKASPDSKVPSGASTLIDDHPLSEASNLDEGREKLAAALAQQVSSIAAAAAAAAPPVTPAENLRSAASFVSSSSSSSSSGAAEGLASSAASTSSNVPLPTPSIAISRVGPSLRNLASAATAANFDLPPLAPRVMPAQKRFPSGGLPAEVATPPKVSVGFCSQKLDSSAAATASSPAPLAPLAGNLRASASQFPAKSATAAAAAASPAPAERARPLPKKKFFLSSSDSDDSSSELEDSYPKPAARLPPKHLAPSDSQANAPASSSATSAAPAAPAGIFCKVDPQGPDPKVSKLSSLLKTPRRTVPVRPSHLTNSHQFFNPNHRNDDFLPGGFCESESLRRGLQLDRKPLFDVSLGLSTSAASFATTPNVW